MMHSLFVCGPLSLSLSLSLSLCPADPRRPYPQDIEMRSGYLGGFSPPDPQSEVGKFGGDLPPSSEPPEKKIALSTNGGISLQGREALPSTSVFIEGGKTVLW